jgi:tyrosine-protein phosphatase SIW14
MLRTLAAFLAVLTIGFLIVGPSALVYVWDREMRNLRTVQPGVLYRSGQLSPEGLERVVHDHVIRTVITLRDAEIPGDPPPDLKEEEFCKKMGIAHFRLRPEKWWSPDGKPPVEQNVVKFRKILDNPANYPILIHCFAGIHRTGAYCALFRMEYQGWTVEQAIEEMKECGYTTIDEEVSILTYLENYVPTWKKAGRDTPPPLTSRALGRKGGDPAKDGDPDF